MKYQVLNTNTLSFYIILFRCNSQLSFIFQYNHFTNFQEEHIYK